MNTPHKIELKDKTFEFYHKSVFELNSILINTLKIVGGPLTTLIKDTTKIDIKANPDQLSEALKSLDFSNIATSLLSTLTPEDLENIILNILSNTTCGGIGLINKMNMDKCCNNDIVFMYTLTIEAFKYYYKDSLTNVLSSLSQQMIVKKN